MQDFKDHKTKQIIRDEWCKPLLGHINKKLGYKLVYLGLPGIKALDIISWIDYIEKVIAFQCRQYGEISMENQMKDNIDELNNLLSDLETKGKIATYSLFDGYIEEVVLRGRDNSGNDYSQNDIVTVYNLDFCNSLTSPITVINDNGTITKHYKIEAVRKLLEYQRDVTNNQRPKKFVMFLTVHSKFWEDEAEKLKDRIDSHILGLYTKTLSGLNNQDKIIRLLKLYTYYILKNHFCNCEFIPEILPPIYYEGTGDNLMICFTIIGTYKKDPSASAPCFQDPKSFIENKFLYADKNGISCLVTNKIKEKKIETNPIKLFSNTVSYNKYW